jgi:hypothetical protein
MQRFLKPILITIKPGRSFWLNCFRYSLKSVINTTLDLMVTLGGPGALSLVQNYIPRYCYFDPKD